MSSFRFLLIVMGSLTAAAAGDEQPARSDAVSESAAEAQLLDDAEAIARRVCERYGPDAQAQAEVSILSLSGDERLRVKRSQFVSFEYRWLYSRSGQQRQVLLRCAPRRGPRVAVNFDRDGKLLSRESDVDPASRIYTTVEYVHLDDVLQRLHRFEPVVPCSGQWPTRRAKTEREASIAGRTSRLVQHWYCNGRELSRLTYRYRDRDGEFRAWHDNGQVWCQGRFADDLPAGKWQRFNPEGTLLQELAFRDGHREQSPRRSGTPLEFPGQLGARNFALTIAQGNAPVGGGPPPVLWQTSATGRCAVRFGSGWKAEFQLTEALQRELRDLLRDIDFFALSDRYDDPHVHDGGWMQYTLRIGGDTKSIRCTNSYPRPLRDILEFVNEDVLPPFAFEIAAAAKDENPFALGWRSSLLEDPPPE